MESILQKKVFNLQKRAVKMSILRVDVHKRNGGGGFNPLSQKKYLRERTQNVLKLTKNILLKNYMKYNYLIKIVRFMPSESICLLYGVGGGGL